MLGVFARACQIKRSSVGVNRSPTDFRRSVRHREVFELPSALFKRIIDPVPELFLSLLVLLDRILKVDKLDLLQIGCI